MRGHYDLFYEQYSDGTEEFVVTRDGDTYRYKALRRQQGFGRVPVVQSGTWRSNGMPEEVRLDTLTLLPTAERYWVARGRLRGGVTRKGKFLRTADVAFPVQTALHSPLVSSDYFLFLRLQAMAEGEERRVETVVLGGPEGGPQRQLLDVTRQADETVSLSGGRTVLCHRFRIRGDNGAGIQTDVWVNGEGVVVKQVITEGARRRSALLTTPSPDKP